MVDVSHLLSPVSAESPCGDDLEYDASYLELERIAQGQPERQMGDSVLPAEPPAWRDVRELSSQLLGRSKDLRIANYFLQSAIALEGLAGLAQSLTLVRELLTQFWDGVYPQLDADDDNDPTFRINALTGLASEPVIRLVREANLTSSRAFGAVTLRAALNALDLQRFPSETLTAEQLQAPSATPTRRCWKAPARPSPMPSPHWRPSSRRFRPGRLGPERRPRPAQAADPPGPADRQGARAPGRQRDGRGRRDGRR